MSFTFNWKSFNEESFYDRAQRLLTGALNRSNKPAIIIDKIIVQNLSLGDEPPELEILEIGDLADDRFRGIFKLNYNGNGSMTLSTKIQANPLNVYANNSPKLLPTVFMCFIIISNAFKSNAFGNKVIWNHHCSIFKNKGVDVGV